MSHTVPLIRAAALFPMLRWMIANGRPVEQRLRAVDLGYFPMDDLDRPIPLLNAAAFFREAGQQEGPDIGVRVVSSLSVFDLAMLGKVALGTHTPHDALLRVVAVLPRHCTHEVITVVRQNSTILVREGWSLDFDDETLHIIHQFFVAMVCSLLEMTRNGKSRPSRIEMLPHPSVGLDHLRPWFGNSLHPTATRSVNILIDQSIADLPFHRVGRNRMVGKPPADWRQLRGDGSLAESIRTVLTLMLENGVTPTIDRLTVAAGLSRRTLQRRLLKEGTSFSALFDDVRRNAALKQLGQGLPRLNDLSASLGYSQQSILSRAVRRWTGNPPSYISSKGWR